MGGVGREDEEGFEETQRVSKRVVVWWVPSEIRVRWEA